MKKLFAVAVAFALVFNFANLAYAATFQGGDEYFLPEGETVSDNLYAVGANVIINGIVEGDLFAAGSNISLNNKISNDVNIAGSNITINSEIGDDLRAAGANINISDIVNGEVMAAGGNIIISKSSTVKKDAYLAGGRILIQGIIEQDLKAEADKVEINGTINGNVIINNASEITISNNAVINGNLIYSGLKEAQIKEGAQIKGEVKFEKLEKDELKNKTKGTLEKKLSLFLLYRIIACIIFAIILRAIFKKKMDILINYTENNAGKSALIGFLFLTATPVALLITAITLIGIPIALSGSLIYALLIILGRIGAGIVCGSLLFKLIFKQKQWEITWQSIVCGIIIINMLSIIPKIGWLIFFIFFLLALGALANSFYIGFKKVREG